MYVKALALDMDGTLLDSNNHIHQDLIDLIAKLRQHGIKIFLATGRTRHDVDHILPDDFAYDGAVTSNGMDCYTPQRTIAQHFLDESLVKELVQLAQDHQLFYTVHSSYGKGVALNQNRELAENMLEDTVPETMKEHEVYSLKKVIQSGINWVDELDLKSIVKLYFFSMNLEKIKNWQYQLDVLKQTRSFSTTSSSLHNVEVMVKNVSKATGLTQLLNEYNISDKALMAIGDGENDLSMFDLSAFSVAMDNAPIVIKQQADNITKRSHDEHGLYFYLKETFDQP